MRPSALVAAATIVVLAFGVSACKSSSKSGAPAPASNAPATETQADSDNPNVSAPPSTTPSASTSPAASAAASATPAAAAGGEINACSLLTGAQASSLTGRQYGAGTPSTIAKGQDQCTYPYSGPSIALTVIVYGPSSGVGWTTMQAVLSGEGAITQVPGVGDKAMFSSIELDIQTGKWLIAIQGADNLNQDTGAIAIGKELVGALASK